MAAQKKSGKKQSSRHPLESDLGTTTVREPVVSAVANVAVQEIQQAEQESQQGNQIPGDRSRTVGEVFDSFSGGASRQRGLSVEVGDREAAVDMTVSVPYGKSIVEVTESIRQNVIRRVEELVGLTVTEVNIDVRDVTLDEQ